MTLFCSHTSAYSDAVTSVSLLLLYHFCWEGLRENMPRKRRSVTPATKKTMYHHDGDRCAALDCLKPKSNRVSWVCICLLVYRFYFLATSHEIGWENNSRMTYFCVRFQTLIGPIPWVHSGPLSRVVVVVVDIDAQAARDSTASDTWWMGVRQLAVTYRPNIFQMLLV